MTSRQLTVYSSQSSEKPKRKKEKFQRRDAESAETRRERIAESGGRRIVGGGT
jgi:hypothetical protein